MPQHDDNLEPILDVNDIQGNILAGFNKDHQTLLGFTIDNIDKTREYMQIITKEISTLYEVFGFNKAYKSRKQRLGKDFWNDINLGKYCLFIWRNERDGKKYCRIRTLFRSAF